VARLKKEAFHSSILDLEIAGQSQQVLLRDVHHPFKQLVLHVDFQRVDAKKKLHEGAAALPERRSQPGVKLSSAIVSHVTTEIEVECLPAALPEFLEVDLSKIEQVSRRTEGHRTAERRRAGRARRSRKPGCRLGDGPGWRRVGRSRRRNAGCLTAAHAPFDPFHETVDATRRGSPGGFFFLRSGRCRHETS
jgi:hypothetical protein